MLKIACIGEAMIELHEKSGAASTINRAIGGDTLNTAIYLKRLMGKQADVHYVTQLGDDPYSAEMLINWENEGINCSFIHCEANAVPGLYSIKTDKFGERQFFYWRDNSPAKALFTAPESLAFLDELAAFDLIYFSGITLAILFDKGREKLLQLCQSVAKRGGKIAFDGNYRPRLWQDSVEAAQWLNKGYKHATMALPTFDDEQLLIPDLTQQQLMDRLVKNKCSDIAIKNGPQDCFIKSDGQIYHAPPTPVENIIDTTAAGDSFNAGFIAARLTGADGMKAAALGHKLAGRVITKRGAIMLPQDMEDITA